MGRYLFAAVIGFLLLAGGIFTGLVWKDLGGGSELTTEGISSPDQGATKESDADESRQRDRELADNGVAESPTSIKAKLIEPENGGSREASSNPSGTAPPNAALSTDRKRSAWISDNGSTLYIQDQRTKALSTVQLPTNLESYSSPVFSLDGGYVYFNYSEDSLNSEIFQIRLADGRTKKITHGHIYGLIRTGPKRGYMVLSRRTLTDTGMQSPYWIVPPDLHEQIAIPNCDDLNDCSPRDYISAQGWTYW